jgi:hypothetical protein
MRSHLVFAAMLLFISACGGAEPLGGDGDGLTTTTVDLDEPVDSDGDQPIVEPGPVGSIPEPRPPIDGNIDGEVWISSAELRIMESYPIQVMLDVTGEKPTSCHEIFWTVEDTGNTIDIEMISQITADQVCAQAIAEFSIAVPLGSWADESREVFLNGESVGSFDS